MAHTQKKKNRHNRDCGETSSSEKITTKKLNVDVGSNFKKKLGTGWHLPNTCAQLFVIRPETQKEKVTYVAEGISLPMFFLPFLYALSKEVCNWQ